MKDYKKEARREALRRDMRDYGIDMYDMAERSGCSDSVVWNAGAGRYVSDDALAAMENALFVIKMEYTHVDVIKEWEKRCAALGKSPSTIARYARLSSQVAKGIPKYLAGKMKPKQSTIQAFERALAEAEKRKLKEAI